MIRLTLTSVLLALIVLAASAAQPAFPLRLGENRRHLVDQGGAPFLYQADTPWMLFTKLTVDLTKLSGERVAASWFNPRTGETNRIAEFAEKKHQTFEPPAEGDWVLVLVDPTKVRSPQEKSGLKR